MDPSTVKPYISLLARASVSLKSVDAVSPAVQQPLEYRTFCKDTNNMRDLSLEPKPLGRLSDHRRQFGAVSLFFTLDSGF